MKRGFSRNRQALQPVVATTRRPFGYCGVELEQLKKCLLFEHKRAVHDYHIQSWFDRAADEAASIAWATTYPLLVFPVLLEEKLAEAGQKARVQRDILERSANIVALAA